MTQVNLSMKKKHIHRRRELTCGCQGERGVDWKFGICKCVKVLDTQSCPTLSHPMNCSPPGSSVHGTLQPRIPEWVAVSFSRGSSRPRDQTSVSVPPALQADSLPLSCQGRVRTVGKLSKIYQFSSFTQFYPTLCDPMPARFLCPWDSPSKNTGVGCHFLLQGIFPTQGSNLRPLNRQADSLPLSYLECRW